MVRSIAPLSLSFSPYSLGPLCSDSERVPTSMSLETASSVPCPPSPTLVQSFPPAVSPSRNLSLCPSSLLSAQAPGNRSLFPLLSLSLNHPRSILSLPLSDSVSTSYILSLGPPSPSKCLHPLSDTRRHALIRSARDRLAIPSSSESPGGFRREGGGEEGARTRQRDGTTEGLSRRGGGPRSPRRGGGPKEGQGVQGGEEGQGVQGGEEGQGVQGGEEGQGVQGGEAKESKEGRRAKESKEGRKAKESKEEGARTRWIRWLRWRRDQRERERERERTRGRGREGGRERDSDRDSLRETRRGSGRCRICVAAEGGRGLYAIA